MNETEELAEMLADAHHMFLWAETPGAKAQYRAALDVARRVRSTVTEGELCAILWAAHKAAEGRP